MGASHVCCAFVALFTHLPLTFYACSSMANETPATLSSKIENHTAYIPPQCYTKTTKVGSTRANPCYTCHTQGQRHNYIDDSDLQINYSFPAKARVNPYKNLFLNWAKNIKSISDKDIAQYINTNNYEKNTKIVITEKLNKLPKHWDLDKDNTWDGYKPDAYFNFDEDGFDRNPKQEYTGWRSFAYYPFPGTFWPTNGSIGDVLIRLPEIFQLDKAGIFSLEVYKINLSILKAIMLRQDVYINTIKESIVKVDLNNNRKEDYAQVIKYHSDLCYVGLAKNKICNNNNAQHVDGLFPIGTEFLHSLRYLSTTPGSAAPRMKELRYAKKYNWLKPSELWQIASREILEKERVPNGTKLPLGDFERGMNVLGWRYQGFIEDAHGELRPQDQEESFFCVGCHGGVGAQTDSIFSFTRAINHKKAKQYGWYHHSQATLQDIPDRKIQLSNGKSQGEYLTYLQHNLAADEYRDNEEAITKFFHRQKLKSSAAKRLKEDVSYLLYPSKSRAIQLNKAYWLIVQNQSFKKGRLAVFDGRKNIHKKLKENQPTQIKKILSLSRR